MTVATFLANALGFTVRSAASGEQTLPTEIMPPPRSGAVLVDNKSAMTLTAVFRSFFVLQTAAMQLSIDTWRDGVRLEGSDFPSVVAHPAPDMDTTDLIAETVACLASRGNAYWLIARNNDHRVSAIQPLNPLECQPILDKDGRRSVMYRGKRFSPEKLRHLRLLRVPGEAEGLGPIQSCMRTLAGARDMSDYAAAWMTTSGVPTGVLTTDQPITADDAKAAKKRWNESNSHTSGVAVLGHGLKFSPLHLKPAEMQFLEARAFDVLEIGRMFGIPAHMLLASLDGSSMTYQNITSAATDFVRWTLMGYLRPIETALTGILPRGTTARFNLNALLRADTTERMNTHATAINAKIYTPEYARQIEGITL